MLGSNSRMYREVFESALAASAEVEVGTVTGPAGAAATADAFAAVVPAETVAPAGEIVASAMPTDAPNSIDAAAAVCRAARMGWVTAPTLRRMSDGEQSTRSDFAVI